MPLGDATFCVSAVCADDVEDGGTVRLLVIFGDGSVPVAGVGVVPGLESLVLPGSRLSVLAKLIEPCGMTLAAIFDAAADMSGEGNAVLTGPVVAFLFAAGACASSPFRLPPLEGVVGVAGASLPAPASSPVSPIA